MSETAEKNIKILNLCHIPEEGRLKVLSFSTAEKDRISEVLEYGERADGSSLFSFIEPNRSDIYISPRISRAFIDPFAMLPTLNIPSTISTKMENRWKSHRRACWQEPRRN